MNKVFYICKPYLWYYHFFITEGLNSRTLTEEVWTMVFGVVYIPRFLVGVICIQLNFDILFSSLCMLAIKIIDFFCRMRRVKEIWSEQCIRLHERWLCNSSVWWDLRWALGSSFSIFSSNIMFSNVWYILLRRVTIGNNRKEAFLFHTNNQVTVVISYFTVSGKLRLIPNSM